jgi:hypothetical protein
MRTRQSNRCRYGLEYAEQIQSVPLDSGIQWLERDQHMFGLSFPRAGYRDGLKPYPLGRYGPEKELFPFQPLNTKAQGH